MNEKYQNFIISIMKNLHARMYEANKINFKELDECMEILFVFKGKYNIGYEINKKQRFKRQFGCSTSIGGF